MITWYITIVVFHNESRYFQLISGEVTVGVSFLLRSTRPVSEEMVTCDYLLNMDRIRGRFSITRITGEELLILKFDGCPDIKSR